VAPRDCRASFDFTPSDCGATNMAMSNDPKEWFRILDLCSGASLDEVKRSYRELAKVWHPDRFAHDPSLLRKSQEKMKQLNHAYHQLCTLAKQPGENSGNRAENPAHSNSTKSDDSQTRSASGPPPERPQVTPPMASMSGGGDASVHLTWSPVYGASSYNVKRSTVSGGPYTTIARHVAWTDHVDSSVINGTRYYYVVSSVDGSQESAHSPELTAQPLAVPAPPANLRAILAEDGKGVQLGWSQSASPEIRWNIIYRSMGDVAYVQIAQISAGITYTDPQMSRETACTYTVTAVNSNAQQSPHSNSVSVRTESAAEGP
jgi:hypothetical protein